MELFPVNFTAYRHHPDLDTEQHVKAIAELLAPFGLHLEPWPVPGHERDRQAVEDRLGAWKQPATRRYANSVLYWAGHGSAGHLAHQRTPAPIDDGIFPEEVAHAIGGRQLHPDAAPTWVIVVLDACFSHEFAQDVHLALLRRHRSAKRYLLLSTAARGYAELGAFTHALKRALSVTFLGKEAIGLAEFGQELARDLGGYSGTNADDHRDRLVRLDDDIVGAVFAPLDQIDEVRAVIDQLPPDERRHFVPKASGAEFGELAWYFHGRTVQRDRILRWLTTTHQGVLVVTGPAGSGKSALLGHILLHTNTRLRNILLRHGHLTPLPPGTPCPDNPFDLTAHLAGLTLHHTIQLIADAADLPDLADEAAHGQPAADLTSRLITELRDRQTRLTLLFDALDEADQPLVIADTLLGPLAALPGIRLAVGTRRSTHEGPDRPAPADADLLDALRPRPHPTGAGPGTGLELVEVDQDPEALAGYLRAKLTSAKQRGALDADDADIAAAVHRLVADHQQGDGEPQQFLYARLAAHELLNNPHLITDPTPLVGRTHRQLFARALQRLDRTNPHYTPLLHALGLAQGRGLPDQDGIWATTANALAPAAETRNSIQELLRDGAPYLAVDQEHGQSVYRLAHRTFTERFTSRPGTARAHAAVTTALIHHTTLALKPPSAERSTGTRTAPAVSPYIRHHLAAHARLGHTAGALHTLGENPAVLDTLDLTTIASAVSGHSLPTSELPPAIAGTALLQHRARHTTPTQQDEAAAAWRRWWRRLGTTYIQGTPPPAEPHPHGSGTKLPDLVAGSVHRRRLHLQITGHTGRARAVAVFTAPGGPPRLATAGDDGTVRTWDPTTGTQVGEPLTGHDGTVRAVAVFTASDGTTRLAAGGGDGTVRIWDPTTGTQVGEPLTGHDGHVDAVAAFTAPDGTTRLATGSGDGTVRIWNPTTGTQVGEPLTGHDGHVDAVAAFTAPDGTT
ncbi:AAA family ATPase, partial [Streptomyces sp. NPDC001581]|uniref:AAA family ATPase n=1 Tax=Streptomyces sp. NPDC001581 TaxID=3154386 RepID=UPI00332C3AA0